MTGCWRRCCAVLLSLLICAVALTNAERPVVASATAKIFDTFVTANITGAVAVFTVTFHIPIGIEGTPLTDYKGQTISRDPNDGVTILKVVPNILSASKTTYLKCGATIFPAMTEAQLLGTAAPTGLIALHPTAEPGTSLHAALGGSVCTALEWFDDRASYAILMNGTINGVPFTNQGLTPETLFTPGGCYLKFGIDAQNSLEITNLKTSEPLLPQAVFFNRTEFLCTKEGVQRMVTCRNQHSQHLLDVLTPRSFFSWITSAHRGSMYESFVGCRRLLESSIVTKTVSTVHERAVGCVYREGTPEAENSPCCNQALAYTSCCAPQRLNVTREVIRVYNVTAAPIADCQQNAFRLALDAYMSIRDFAQFDNSKDALAAHAVDMRFNEVLDEFNTISEMHKMCQYLSIQTQKRFATDCRAHTDCLLSNVCDFNSGKCKVRWETLHTAFAVCIHNHLPDDVISSLQALRGMAPQSQDILDDTLLGFTQDMDQRVPLTLLQGQAKVSAAMHQFPSVLNMTGKDCVGLNSEFSRSNYTEDVDEDGNWITVDQPTNVTNCPMAGRICNHDSRYYLDEQSCTGAYQTTNYGDHFCAVSDAGGNDFRDIGKPGGCFAPTYNNSADCVTSGNNWYNESSGFAGCLRAGITSLDGCLGSGGSRPPCTTHAAAVAAAVSAGTYRYDNAALISHPVCSIRHCYASLSESNCNLLHTSSTPQWHTTNPMIKVKASAWYNAETSLCIAPLHHFPLFQQTSDRCHEFEANFTASPGPFTPGTFSYHEGYTWRQGSWDTKTRCETFGHCSLPYLNHFAVTESQCREALDCPHSCSRCVSALKDSLTGQAEKNMCYDINALAENACHAPARWLNYSTTSHLLGGIPELHGICEYPTSDATACAALSGGTFLSCGDLTTQANCKIAGTIDHSYQFSWIYKALQCGWSTHEGCRSQAECLAEGRCDDDELNVCTCKPGLLCSCQGGSCIEQWHIDPVTQSKNKCLLGNSNIVQTRIGCKNLTITTEADCLLAGGQYKWAAKAHTQAECIAHGSGCYGLTSTDQFAGDFVLGRNDTECSRCGSGNTTTHYRWLVGNDDLDADTTVETNNMKSRVIRYPQQLSKELFRTRMYQTTKWLPKQWVASANQRDTIHSSRTEQSGFQLAALVAGTKLMRRLVNHFDRAAPSFAQIAVANWTTSCDPLSLDGLANPTPMVSHPLFIGRPAARNDYSIETLGTLTSIGCVDDPDCTQELVPGQTTHLKLCQKCPSLNGTLIPACRCRKPVPDPERLVPVIVSPDPVTGPVPSFRSIAAHCDCLLDDGTVYPPLSTVSVPVKAFPVTGVSRKLIVTALSHVPAGVVSLDPITAFTGGSVVPALTKRRSVGGLILATLSSFFKPTVLVATSAIADAPSADLYRNIHSGACDNKKTVGQLVGSCFLISASDISAFPMYVSWAVDPHVVQDNVNYPIADFCATTFLNGPPLNAPDSLYNGTHISATIPTSGLWCPCIHEQNWEADNSCTSSSSGLTTTQIILISVFGTFGGVILLLSIYACFKSKVVNGERVLRLFGKPGYRLVRRKG